MQLELREKEDAELRQKEVQTYNCKKKSNRIQFSAGHISYTGQHSSITSQGHHV